MTGQGIYTLVEDKVREEILYPAIDSCVGRNRDGPHVFVEIGVFLGGNLSLCFSRSLHNVFSGENLTVKDFEPWFVPPPKNLITFYGIDTFTFDNISDEGMIEGKVSGDYYQLCCENLKDTTATIVKMDSIEASKTFIDNYIDILFLDGDHGANYVNAELDAWIPKVKKGGIIAGHDFNSEAISKAVYKRFPKEEVNICSTGTAYQVRKK